MGAVVSPRGDPGNSGKWSPKLRLPVRDTEDPGKCSPGPAPPLTPFSSPTGSGGHGSHDTHGDGEGAQGNTVARIVSPIVSVVAVALVGAGVSYFRSGRWRACLRRGDPGTV
ncbi:glycoprotein Xg [Microtus ochrogaster]|uniref:Glycoprotein Xg n=1 Tax=Microtus ochrogaster TaxID=79684 RepID=A0ABM1TX37_MICOH|nr:glycoprotein Xg [Microtus ochrogaster]